MISACVNNACKWQCLIIQNCCKLKGIRHLRSSDKVFLDYSMPSTKYGESAFSVSGSGLWNSLPDNIRLLDDIGSLKSKLKTWLFNDAYKEHL